MGTSFKFHDEHISIPSACAWDLSRDTLIWRSVQESTFVGLFRMWGSYHLQKPFLWPPLSFQNVSFASEFWSWVNIYFKEDGILYSLQRELINFNTWHCETSYTCFSWLFKKIVLVCSLEHFNSTILCMAAILCMADSLQRLQVLETCTTFIILDVTPQWMPWW